MSNIFKYIIQTSMWCIIASYVRPESVIQTFLAESGITEGKIAMVVTFMQVFQTAFILLLSPIADKTRNVIKAISLSLFLCIPMLFFLLFNCFISNISLSVLIILSVIAQIGVAFFYVYVYKLAYHIMDINMYSIVQSRASAIGSTVAFVSSLVITMALSHYLYFPVMSWVYSGVIICILIFFFSTFTMKRCASAPAQSDKKINIFKYPPFYKLILPNIARGFSMGALYMATTIGYYYNILNAVSSSVLLILAPVSGIVISFLFPSLEKKAGLKNLFLITPAVAILTMPMITVTGSAAMFLIFYGISFLTVTVMDIAIPVAVIKLIDYEVSGKYNAYRMTLQTLGTSLFTASGIFLLDKIGGTLTLLLSGMFLLFSGISYYRCLKE